MVEQESIEAYKQLEDILGQKQLDVIRCIRKHPEGITNTEISRELQQPINTITPRTNELHKAQLITQHSKRPCKITGKTAKTWTINKQ